MQYIVIGGPKVQDWGGRNQLAQACLEHTSRCSQNSTRNAQYTGFKKHSIFVKI